MKNDVQLQHDVLAELDWEPSVEAAQIGVTTRDGVVALTGHVATYAEKRTAEDVAKRVHGVLAVANDLEVRPPESHRCDDADLAAAAVHALRWDSHVPQDRIQVTVRDGVISLEGTVDRRFQRMSAERAVRRLRGVLGVDNEIVVEHADASAPEHGGIASALRRSASVNSRGINIELRDKQVILTGDVRSHAERDEAERIAWRAPNVKHVENCISITPWGQGPAEEWGY
ncbi:MAG: BON domain-containing protein [Pirellulaceae bacterium]